MNRCLNLAMRKPDKRTEADDSQEFFTMDLVLTIQHVDFEDEVGKKVLYFK